MCVILSCHADVMKSHVLKAVVLHMSYVLVHTGVVSPDELHEKAWLN